MKECNVRALILRRFAAASIMFRVAVCIFYADVTSWSPRRQYQHISVLAWGASGLELRTLHKSLGFLVL